MDPIQLRDLDFAGRPVTIVGLGIEGADLAHFLCRQGASVTVSDSKAREQLVSRLHELADLPLAFSLGSEQATELADAEELFVSQGVPLDLPGLKAAAERGATIRSMMGLFLDLCPGPVVGITGSSGKTTTTALVAAMFEADERPSFVGGNIGVGLLDHLPYVRPYTWSILEISHTQLQLVDSSPHIAAVLNITPNHLDRFSWDEYRRLKANILTYQGAEDIAVLGHDDPECRALEPLVKGRLLRFSMAPDMPGEGMSVENGSAVLRLDRMSEKLFALSSIRLRGRHNQANVVAAAAIAAAAGIQPDAIACAAETFAGVEHRLEFVADVDGTAYYNDSIATTPERTVAGLRSFGESVVLLLGGRDKNLPLDELVRQAAASCRAVLLFGEAAEKFADAFSRVSLPVERADTLEAAVDRARSLARDGDVILLSPACTSYDAYENFEKRGEHFRSLVRAMVKEAQPSLP
jgi:UDP-N-acetylmuramoylalanine--D-glutamate ligase